MKWKAGATTALWCAAISNACVIAWAWIGSFANNPPWFQHPVIGLLSLFAIVLIVIASITQEG